MTGQFKNMDSLITSSEAAGTSMALMDLENLGIKSLEVHLVLE